jgi:membrane glycosyltransferase
MLAESLFSTLAAPVRMLFHTRFVAAALLGLSHQWKSPSREDTKTRWGEALLRHGCDTLLGVGWAAALYFVDPSYLLWLSPVTGALILSIPLSVYTSRISLGRRLRRLRLLLMPEETTTPPELRATRIYFERSATPPDFIQAVADPFVNALVCAACGGRHKRCTGAGEREQDILVGGPDRLTPGNKMAVLDDPRLLSRLHLLVRTSSDAHPLWLGARSGP